MEHKNYGISDMRSGETIVAVVRHHWFVFFRDAIGIVLLLILPFFAVPILGAFIAAGGGVSAPTGFGAFFASFWTLMMWHFLFARWTDYYYDVWIVTSQRIIDINQKGFFNRDTATIVAYDRVEDVEFSLVGFFGNILNFGHVQVQTAGANREFIMEEVANPQRLEKLIRQAVSDEEVRRRSVPGV